MKGRASDQVQFELRATIEFVPAVTATFLAWPGSWWQIWLAYPESGGPTDPAGKPWSGERPQGYSETLGVWRSLFPAASLQVHNRGASEERSHEEPWILQQNQTRVGGPLAPPCELGHLCTGKGGRWTFLGRLLPADPGKSHGSGTGGYPIENECAHHPSD